jgi:hypothetical protein
MVTIVSSTKAVQEVYFNMVKGDRHKAMFFDQDMAQANLMQLLTFASTYGTLAEVRYKDPVGIWWVDYTTRYVADVHVCLYEGQDGHSYRYAHDALNFSFNHLNMTALFATMPKPYRHIRSKAEDVGFTKLYEQKDLCYFAEADKHVPGVVYRLQRDEWLEIKDNPGGQYGWRSKSR